MTVATVASRALAGIDAPEVAVEVHLGPGLPSFTIVGLPDTEVREAKDRVRAALNHTQFEFPARRISVSLSGSDAYASRSPAALKNSKSDRPSPTRPASVAATNTSACSATTRADALVTEWVQTT